MSLQAPLQASQADLLGEVRRSFAASGTRETGLRLGLEVELIPYDPAGGRLPMVASRDGRPSGHDLLEGAGARLGWISEEGGGGVRRFRVPGTGVFTFEPGGQLELSTEPFASVDGLVARVEAALRPLYREAERQGVRLLARGLDPHHAAENVPLLLDTERYRRQSAHYATVGPSGRRMMLQSAAIHVNVDLGGRPLRRWSAANRAAPYLTAIFANSRRYLGADTGFRSYRAEQWRRLDPSRTGGFGDDPDPSLAYLAFALEARDFLGAPEGCPAPPYRRAWEGGAGLETWRAHLGTLFPEVRPRGYLELRSFDALRPAWLAVPLVVTAGLLYDSRALAEAGALLPAFEPERLERAGREGLGDPEIGRTALDLFDLALEGAVRLGEGVVGGAALDTARAYRERFVGRGEDPGSEPDEGDPFEV